MSKILLVRKQVAEADWNKHLPNPLKKGEKVIVDTDQEGVTKGYVRVRHAKNSATSVFNKIHFTDLKGKAV